MQTKIFRSITSNEITCCFCKGTDVEGNDIAVNFTYFQHRNSQKLTETWTEMAKCLEDEYLLVILVHGNIPSK